MKNSCVLVILILAVGALTLSEGAFAHGTEKHGITATGAAQMKKLHAMMPMFSVASAKLEAALDRGDAAGVEAEAGAIIAALPDLKKSKPHKNVRQQKKFVELAGNLGSAATATADLSKKGDFAGAMVAFKQVEEVCAACHAKFRD